MTKIMFHSNIRHIETKKESGTSLDKISFMKTNVGNIDRYLRISLAVVIFMLNITKVISGTLGIFLLVLAVVFGFTAYLRFCPLYLPFGINTKVK
jgi:hypothetical protein